MRVEIRNESVLIDGYVNAVGRDSRPIRGKNGNQFLEQIKPGTFRKAIERSEEIMLLLNHEKNRVLGSTKKNLQLFEDNIGLRAICTITDAEVIKKAKEKKLRGWSFGFHELDASEEETANGMKRRYVEDLELIEVSIVDEKRTPCYAGTSIETRTDGKEDTIETRTEETKAVYQEELNYTKKYKDRIKKLKGEKE